VRAQCSVALRDYGGPNSWQTSGYLNWWSVADDTVVNQLETQEQVSEVKMDCIFFFFFSFFFAKKMDCILKYLLVLLQGKSSNFVNFSVISYSEITTAHRHLHFTERLQMAHNDDGQQSLPVFSSSSPKGHL
jgi:hypothetical protein